MSGVPMSGVPVSVPEAGDCPCGRPVAYPACCGRFHAGADAPTAERLMRSRYSAFVLRDLAHLQRTWHPSTCPGARELAAALAGDRRWTGLEVTASTAGGLLDDEGTVSFRASYEGGAQVERSRFVRLDGAWVYVGPV